MYRSQGLKTIIIIIKCFRGSRPNPVKPARPCWGTRTDERTDRQIVGQKQN